MKSKGILFLILFMTSPCYPEDLELPVSPIALSLIIDAGSSNRPVWNDLHALARQAVASLQAGDTLEVISADPWNPHIRIAQTTIQAKPGEVDNLCLQLRKIELPWIGDTDVVRALELGIDRMKKFRQDHPEITPVFVVLSDGQLRDEEATVCTSLTEQVEQVFHGRLYFTGTKDTSRRLLVQAGDHKIRWSLLQSANCQNWIKEARPKPEPKPEAKTEPRSEAKIEPHETKIVTPEPEPKPIAPLPPSPVVVVPKSPIFQLPTDSYFFQGLSVQAKEPIRTEEPLPLPPQTIEPNVPKQSVIEPVTREPNIVTTQVAVDRSGRASRYPLAPWVWILAVAGIVATALGTLILLYTRNFTKQWRQRITQSLRALSRPENSTLLVRHKDRTWNLGKLKKRMEIPIGSGPKNVIRLFDKDIAVQHLVLWAKGGIAWLKNLAPKPILLNGVPIATGKNSRIVFPSIVRICDTVTLKFEVHTPPVLNPQAVKEEVTHGNA